MKKAQGLPLNTIIIAAIVLIVLIVLWAIFTGRMGKFTSGLKTEEKKAQKEAEKFEKLAVKEQCVGGLVEAESCLCGTGPNAQICEKNQICNLAAETCT